MSPNRIVTLLTPVFAGLAGSVATWMADNLPGAPQISTDGLTAIFVAGAASATAAAYKWLQGWQAHEAHTANVGLTLLQHDPAERAKTSAARAAS